MLYLLLFFGLTFTRSRCQFYETRALLSTQCEENSNLADCSRYLKLPFSKANLPSNNQTLKGTKESFWITSFLCSTKLTQNGKRDSGADISAVFPPLFN